MSSMFAVPVMQQAGKEFGNLPKGQAEKRVAISSTFESRSEQVLKGRSPSSFAFIRMICVACQPHEGRREGRKEGANLDWIPAAQRRGT